MDRRRAVARSSEPLVSTRVESIDTARGIAIVAMIVYHFVFDLRYFGVVRADFENDPFWLTVRATIVTSFLLIVGISIVLARQANVPPARLVRRVIVIAACAAAASIGSYVIYPQTFIYFGILHCIAVSSVLAWPLAARPRLAGVLGVAMVVAGLTFSSEWFDSRWASWLGFTKSKPPTQDFVPLFPWLGVVLIGITAGDALARHAFAPIRSLAKWPASLRWLGRHSLAVYMVHQPLLMGALWLALRRF
ncbi:MAG TPA: heparan-alpha-glucosaminide N-acetyltransferase [Casimicrobiaceae bacterium]|nr:heparan-alpha-glucosaminide N-acetyltransferase [Casimicrobiaceae bacterium]